MWMGTKLPLLQKSGNGRRRLGWQSPETTTTETPPQQEIQMPQARFLQALNHQRPQNSQKPNQDQYLSQSNIHK